MKRSRTSPLTILLVEDEIIIAMAQKDSLAGEGFNIIIASSGEEAIDIAGNDSCSIDLILMDIDLGKGMDGTQAAEIILKEKSIPLLFLSSHTEKEIVEKTEIISSYGYVVKDSGITILVASIKMALKLHKAYAEIKIRGTALSDYVLEAEDLYHNAPCGYHSVNSEGTIVRISESELKLLGYERDEIVGLKKFSDFFAPESMLLYKDRFPMLLKNGEDKGLIVELVKKNGTRLSVLLNTSAVKDKNGHFILNRMTIFDISDRIISETQLRESREKYENIFNQSPIAIAFYDVEGKLVEANHACRIIFGVDDIKDLIGFDLFEDPNITPEIMNELKDGKPVRFESDFIFDLIKMHKLYKTNKSGKMVLDWLITPLKNETGTVVGYIEQIQNITRRKVFENSLYNSRNKFLQLIENMTDIVCELNPDGEILFVNKRCENILGYPVREMMLKDTNELVHPDDEHNIFRDYFSLLDIGSQYSGERRLLHKDGRWLWFDCSLRLYSHSSGEPRIIMIARDVNERNEILAKLDEKQEIFKLFMEYSPIYVFFKDENIRAIDLSRNYEKMLNRPLSELLGKNMEELFPSELAHVMVEDDKKVIREGKPVTVMEELDGRTFTTIKFPIFRKGKQSLIAGFTTDITDFVQSREALEKTIREKEILLKELQHRVKNNLSIISSLLGMDINNLSDEKSKNIFKNAQSRIHSMTIIYGMLYGSETLESIDLHLYIENLVSILFDTLVIDKSHIRFKTEMSEVTLDLKRAVPLGLILNELITNVLKYAFPAEENGTLTVSLASDKTEIVLKVSDDGTGLSDSIDPDTSNSMGFVLVRMLTGQIGGSVTFTSKKGKGLLVEIHFPK